MCLYNILIRPFARRMDLDKASRLSLQYFRLTGTLAPRKLFPWLSNKRKNSNSHKEVFGLIFEHPIGMGAGFDKQGLVYNKLSSYGFSFIEIGPLDSSSAVSGALHRLNKQDASCIIAACIRQDYLTSFTLAYDFFDFFVIDIPNFAIIEELDRILESRIAEAVYKPIVVRIPEYISDDDLASMIKLLIISGIDGFEASSLSQTRKIKELPLGKLPIISNANISTYQDVEEALEAGADLIGVRSALVREGPSIVRKIIKNETER